MDEGDITINKLHDMINHSHDLIKLKTKIKSDDNI